MFKVDADSLSAYLAFDPRRKPELLKLDAAIRRTAPALKRHFHRGTPAGQPGMRFNMIGYGRSSYLARNGQRVAWPALGVALQKIYISVYVSVRIDGQPIVRRHAGRLGAVRTAPSNFSFERFDDLDATTLSALLTEVGAALDAWSGPLIRRACAKLAPATSAA
jgi:hypothetical protein